MLSIACAALSVISAVAFLCSGFVLSGVAIERTIVIVQLSTTFAVPAFALLGLFFGVVAMFYERSSRAGMIGTILSAVLLAGSVLALAFLMIASFTVAEESSTVEPRPDRPAVRIEVEGESQREAY